MTQGIFINGKKVTAINRDSVVEVIQGSHITNSFNGSMNFVNGKAQVIVDGVAHDIKDFADSQTVIVEVKGDVGTVKTMSGDVKVTGNVDEVETMSGDVRAGGNITKARTMSGDITGNTKV